MSAIDQDPFPRSALIAAGVLVALTVGATAAARLQRLSLPLAPQTAPAAAAAVSVDLRFSDAPDGSIRVLDARTDRLVARIEPGTGGFVRGVMRGLARDRIARHIGSGPPFRLFLDHARGLWLQDLATGRLIDLQSFGLGNRQSFVDLLAASRSAA
jgi:putative photosynthetic complex assembly protein